MKKILSYIFIVALVVLGVQACKTYYFRSNYMDANSLIHSTNNLQTKPFLKAHLKSGDVCLLKDSWKVDTSLNYVQGIGTLFNFNREEKYQGTISIPIDSVAIFETNVKINNPESARLTALALITALDVAIGAICATNPKT